MRLARLYPAQRQAQDIGRPEAPLLSHAPEPGPERPHLATQPQQGQSFGQGRRTVVVEQRSGAAQSGLALLRHRRYCVAADLAAGTLTTLLPNHKLPRRPLLAVYPRAIKVSRKINLFIAFLSRWFRQSDPNNGAAART